MDYHLKTMGDLRLLDRQGRGVGFPEKGLLIVSLLVSESAAQISRRRLSRLFWPDSSPETAAANLRKTVSRIVAKQVELDAQFLLITDTSIGLDGSDFDCDLSIICDPKPNGISLDDLRMIDAAFSGPFLEYIELPAGDLTAWRDRQRQRLIDRFADVIASASRIAETSDDRDVVKQASARLFQHDPGNRSAHLPRAPIDFADDRAAFRALHKLTVPDGLPVAAPDVRAARRLFDFRQNPNSPLECDVPDRIPAGPLPRIALLPPNLAPLGTGAMIAQSLVEDVTIALAASRRLQIVAPYTAAKMRESNDKPALFEKHRISYVLDTKHSLDGDRPFLFVQLIHFANDEVIWAQRLPLEEGKLAFQRGELAQQVSTTVSDQVSRTEKTREYFEKSPAAYYHYLLAQRYLTHLTLPDLRRARREFRSALALSSDFSPALSGIARTLTKEWLLTARGDIDLLKAAEGNARQAIILGQDLPSGYRELGVAKMLRGDIDESVEAFSLAEAMSPHYADVIADFADTLTHASRPDLALDKIEFAIDLNPVSPDSYLWTAAGACYFLQRYEDALRYIGAMRDGELAIRLAAASWAMLGNAKKARHLVAKARETHPDFDVERWLSVVPMQEQWQKELYREGLKKAGF